MILFRRFICFILFALCLFSAFSVCSFASDSSEAEVILTGKWGYIHDPDTPSLIIKANGKAELDGKKYTYSIEDNHLVLTDKKGKSESLRFLIDDTGIYLYKNAVYQYDGEDEPSSLEGVWKCEEYHWSYEFTSSGSFKEDGFFPGYYTVNEEDSSFTLVYNDQFEDTTCFYQLNGSELTVSYPWRMVKIK